MSADQFLAAATKRQVKKATVSETDIEKAFCAYAESRGCKALKLIILNARGFPDRTVMCGNARLFFIEFKAPGKKITALQSRVRRVLESFGFTYHVCDQLGQAETILDMFLDFRTEGR